MDTRTLIEARNPVWAEPDCRAINLECRFEEISALGFIPFTASLDDPAPHGVEIFVFARQGKFGPVAPYQAASAVATE